MGLFNSIRLGSSAAGDYEIEKSLRINKPDNPQLYRTGSNNADTFTVSMWIKIGRLYSSYRVLFASYSDGLTLNNDHRLRFSDEGDGSFYSTAKFRDPTAWYHIVMAVNTSGTTVYVNNVTHITSSSKFNLSTASGAIRHFWQAGDPAEFAFDGYGAEVALIDGQALTPSSFAKTDALTGQWIPKDLSSLTFGSNGHWLRFTDSTNIGKDFSGNSNDFTTANYSTSAGVGNDLLDDTPTNNFCTLNPLDSNTGINFSQGNLVVNTSQGFDLAKSTFYLTSGKWYWEVTCDDTGNGFIGVSDQEDVLNNRGGGNATSCTIRATNGHKRISGSTSSYGSAIADGDVMMFAVDKDANKFWAGKNGTWFNSGDPAAGSNEATSALTNPVSPSVSLYDNEDYTFNFGQRAFSYTPPTGYKKICTANLPDPSITFPDKHFDTLLWSGNNSSRNITGLKFDPDWVWAKNRTIAYSHELYDIVRGNTKRIFSDSNNVENSTGALSFGVTGGFALAAGGSLNDDDGTNDIVAWNWKGGGSASSNSDGSITSSVSANTSAGFSIVGYTGNGTGGATVGHGLGVAPKFIITKQRSTSGHHWRTYHASIGATKSLYLDLTNAQTGTDAGFMNNTEPTSTVFSIGTDTNINENGETHIAYCFSEVAGYSKIGSYTGNGSSDGMFVFTGFRPAVIIVKRSSATQNWLIFDNKRGAYNPDSPLLYPNLNNTEDANTMVDFVSNGFKWRAGNLGGNDSGSTFIYLAFAETPFKYSRAR